MIREQSVEAFLQVVASDAPVPGGGSVAAVAGATGAALVAMVARLTAGREGFADVDGRMREIAAEADRERDELLALADRDADAFGAVMAAFKLPKTTEEEKASRSAAIQQAYAGAAAVPLEVARRAVGLMQLAREVIASGNPDAASDGASAGAMLFASALSAGANVHINVSASKDPAVAAPLRQEGLALQERASELLNSVEWAFRERTSRG